MRKERKYRTRRFVAILMTFVMAFTFYGGSSAIFADDNDDNPQADGKLNIKSVEVLTSGDKQSVYRQSVYKGDVDNGEDPDKYYTTYRGINLNDPREFTFEFTVDKATVGEDPDAFLDTIDLKYGVPGTGTNDNMHPLSEWKNRKGQRGSANTLRDPQGTQYLKLGTTKAIKQNGNDTYTVTLTMDTDCPWTTTNQSSRSTNVPYNNYGATKQLNNFSNGQSADNRWWWQTTPTNLGLGTYTMTAYAGSKDLASAKIPIQQYDGGNSWIQKNEFAQSLVKAINGAAFPKSEMAKKTTGLIAAGYVKTDDDGNFVEGDRADSVYVEVSILGYGLTDNEAEENKAYNNYARYNAIWNIVVAQDEDKVDTYLNETKPMMNEHPEQLIEKYKDKSDKDIDMINVFYETNVHSDEISGIDHTIKFVTDLIDGGKEGKKIDYYTWKDSDMTYRYRDPADGYTRSTAGHIVTGGYADDSRFWDKSARTEEVFDTKEALDKFIIVNNITTNPDGQAGMRRTNRYSFDLNRDAVFSTMPETIALMKDIMKWDPLVEDEWHGYVTNMLIEPCTAPHDPAYDYDLLANNMRNLTYAAGKAVTANTGHNNFLVPWDHYDGGDWDDGGTIYSPMFAELLGCFGYTIEFPWANSDAFDAGSVINYAQINELLHGTTDFYAGNRLNGPLEDVNGQEREGHIVDIISQSMRKNSILSKLETKKRGIENIDSMAADKYFIDKKNGEDKVVGRARPEGKSFFPDYIVIPKGEIQYNFAEGIKAINQMMDWGINVDVTTDDVEYEGKTIPKGSYVLSMYQANRNVIYEVMSKGYDATGFADMYADIYCNLPDVRGFDSIQVYGKDLFEGKTTPQDSNIKKKADIQGTMDEFVTFKSQSTDAVRAVNYLLSKKADVWMLRKDVADVGEASDYVIRTKDLSLVKRIKDDETIGQKGIQLEGKYLSALPAEAVKLVEPIIQFNSTRTAQTANAGPLWYLLDDYLGFGSLKGYNGSSQLRDGANVIIANNVNANSFQDSWVDAIKSGEAGVVFIRNAAGLSKLGSTAPGSDGSFQDVAINGTYNVNDSLFDNNYGKTTTYYARGNAYKDLPAKSKVLFRSLENGEDAFIGGFQPTNGAKTAFGNKTTIFSTLLDGEDFAKPVSTIVFGQQMDYRSHYQKLLPMLATAIYAGAAGIVDDMAAPTIGELAKDDAGFKVHIEDDERGTGLKNTLIYKVDGANQLLLAEGAEEDLAFDANTDEDLTIKVVSEDKAGNASIRVFTYRASNDSISSARSATTATTALRSLNDKSTLAEVLAAEELYNSLSDRNKRTVNNQFGGADAVATLIAEAKETAKAYEEEVAKAEEIAKKEAEAKAASEAAIAATAEMIKALAENPTEEAVNEAEIAFSTLTAKEKAKVNELVGGKGAVSAIATAKTAVAKQIADAEAAAVAEMIKALADDPTAEDVAAAEIAYSALPAKEKATVNEILGGKGAAGAFAEAEKAVGEKAAAEARVEAVANQIKALGSNPSATAVAEAEKAYNSLSAADKAKVDAVVGGKGGAAAIKAAKQIVAKKAADSKVKAAQAKTVAGFKAKKKGKKAKLSWKATAGVAGYQIQYRKVGTNSWQVLKSSTTKTKFKTKKLKKGKYQFRICTITKVGGKNVLGKWAVAKKIIKIK